MIYIFHVDRGVMLKFEVSIALGSVENLKKVISSTIRIPPEFQILMLSGGTVLMDSDKVCSHNGGTDTCPFFLFSKPKREQNCWIDWRVDSPLSSSLEISEGWATAVANLEDVVSRFEVSWKTLKERYDEYLNKREFYIKLVEMNLPGDLENLSKIPILSCLLEYDECGNPDQPKSLFEWIGSQRLEDFATQIVASLKAMDENKLSEMEKEVDTTVTQASQKKFLEIQGLSKRLSSLDSILEEAKQLERLQKDIAQSLHQNQTRINMLNDRDVLPDLCESHKNHLNDMIRCNEQLKSYLQRISKAKDELSASICGRLRWVVLVHQRIFDADNRVKMYMESLKRLSTGLSFAEMIHLCPELYLNSVMEVARRRAFSDAYAAWSSEVATRAQELYEEEVTFREGLNNQLRSHFLLQLFPGMNELPPDFATKAPDLFDQSLPNVTLAELDFLRDALGSENDWRLPENISVTLPRLELQVVKLFPQEAPIDANLDSGNVFQNAVMPSVNPQEDKSSDFFERKPSVEMYASAFEGSTDGTRDDAESLDSRTVGGDVDDEVFRTASEGEETGESAFSESMTTLKASESGCSPAACASEATSTDAPDIAEGRVSESKEMLGLRTTQLANLRSALRTVSQEMQLLKDCRDSLAQEFETYCNDLTVYWGELNQNLEKAHSVMKTNDKEREATVQQHVEEAAQALNAKHALELFSLRQELRIIQESAQHNNGSLQMQCKELKMLLEQQQQDWDQEKRRLVDEKVTELEALKQTLTLEMEVELENVRESIGRRQNIEIEGMEQDLLNSRTEINRTVEERKALEDLVDRLRDELEVRCKEINDLRSRLQHEKEDRQQETLKHKIEIEGLRSRYKMMTSSSISHSPPSSLYLTESVVSQSPVHVTRSRVLKDVEVMTDAVLSESSGRMVRSAFESDECAQEQSIERQKRFGGLSQDFTGFDLGASAMSIATYNPIDEVPVSDAELVRLNCALKRENSSLREQLLSMPKKSSSLQGKLTTNSCNIGDVVLVRWDPSNLRYTIHQDGPSNYFLHLDSVRDLGLPCGEDEANCCRSLFMVAEVVNRETCLAKKDFRPYGRY
ncbi:unnamed protein product [Notodromas monacha]|uniref:Autophagy protein ATG17-like domain-containing protein n=2 Tax=Notodromas monacha TaxID=399045 RepID=A0A7R9BQY2_9CRUS|nr:unnamed protein product [Notodromas monacha]CAG0920024.1 unnamed protein product [Notodromas monacha]